MQSRQSRGFWIRVLCGWVAPLIVLMLPSWASAQTTIDLAKTYPDRTVKLRASGLQPYWISRSDCLKDDQYIFEATMQGVTSEHSLEVWATTNGSNCADFNIRNSATTSPNCYPVYYATAQVGTREIRVRDQDIVDARAVDPKTEAIGHGTADQCTPTSGTSGSVPVSLYFVLVDTAGQGVASDKYDLKYDLVGPPAPEGVSAGVGENSLVVSWTTSESTDADGFKVYCRTSAPAATGSGGQTGAGGAVGGAPAEGGSAGEGGLSDSGGAGTGETAGVDGTGGSSGRTGTTANANPLCAASSEDALPLIVGQPPDPSIVPCGEVSGGLQSKATASGLENDFEYAVGVAAYDLVGNVGPLSTLACETPQPVDDFYELYRQAGGQAGGGFCATGPARSPWGLAVLAGGWLAWSLRRRRRGAGLARATHRTE
jgi:hypothetical protein